MELLIVLCAGILIILGFVGYLLYCDITNAERHIPRCDFCGKFRKREQIKVIQIRGVQYYECSSCKAKRD